MKTEKQPNPKPIVHLLKPGEYRVFCKPPDFVPGNLTCTTMPSKATCAVCLGHHKMNVSGRGGGFRVSHIPERLPEEI